MRKLRMLTLLDRLGTMSAVARELHLTGPGVSMQLAALERDVGLTLTERSGRQVQLTPAGKLLARHGGDILDRISLAELEATALRDGSVGMYRLAAFPSALRTIVADVWGAVAADGGIQLRVIELEPQDALPALAAGEVDLALAHSYSIISETIPAAFSATRIAAERVRLAVRAADIGDPVADLRDFAREPWIVPGRAWACHEMVQRACGIAGFAPRVVAESNDFAAQLALVGAGVGVALVPELTVAALPVGVILLDLVAPVFRYDFVATRGAGVADGGIRTLTRLLAESAQRLVGANAVTGAA